MPYSFDGVCYETTALALTAWNNKFPLIDGNAVITLTANSTISAGGIISYSISDRPLTGTAATTRAYTVQLPTCTTQSWTDPMDAGIMYVAALFFAAFLGFSTGFRV